MGSAALRLTPTMFGWPLIALGISAFAFPKKMGDGSMRPQPYPTARDAFLGYVPLSEPGLSDAGRGGYLVNDVDAALPIGRTPPPKFPILEEVPATDQELSIHEGGLPVDVPTLEGRPMTPQSFGDTVYLSEANKADANRNGNDHSQFIVNRTYYLGPDHRGEMVTYAAPHALMENELVRVSKSEFMLHRFGNEVTKPDGAYVFASVPNRTEVRFAQSEGAIAPSQLVRPTNDTYEGDLRRVAFPISIGRLPPLLGQMVFDNGTLVKRDVLGGTFKEVNRKVVNGVPQYENVYPGDFPALVSHGPLWALVRLGQEEYGLKRIKDHSGRLVEGVVIDPPVGKYSAVQLSNGVIQVSSKNHLTAAQDDVPVQYAMTLYFSEQSYLDGWTNESGHFRPKIHDGKFVDLPRFRGSNQALDAVYGPIKGWYTKIDPVIFK